MIAKLLVSAKTGPVDIKQRDMDTMQTEAGKFMNLEVCFQILISNRREGQRTMSAAEGEKHPPSCKKIMLESSLCSDHSALQQPSPSQGH